MARVTGIFLFCSKGDDMDEQIIEYIRQHQDTYTREAITTQLVTAGYDQADIEAAFKQVDSDGTDDFAGVDKSKRKSQMSDSKSKQAPMTWWDSKGLGFLLFVISVPAITAIPLTFHIELYRAGINGSLFALTSAALVILGLFLPSLLKSTAPQFGTGVKYALLTLFVVFIVLPFIALVVITGICIVLWNTNAGASSIARSTSAPGPRPTLNLTNASVAHVGENRGEASIRVWEYWSYEGQAGEVLTLRVNADIPWESNQIVNTDGFDPWLLVWSPDSRQLDENFDRSYDPLHTDALIENMSLPVDGIYLINITDYVHDSGGAYTLIIESNLHPTATPSP
jgi:hypothetical protein